jgi:hypothetical protein
VLQRVEPLRLAGGIRPAQDSRPKLKSLCREADRHSGMRCRGIYADRYPWGFLHIPPQEQLRETYTSQPFRQRACRLRGGCGASRHQHWSPRGVADMVC